MAKKKNQSGKQPPKAEEKAELPAPLRMLDADYSAVLRMRNVRWLIVILSVVAALMLGAYLSAVFVPLLVALAIAYILNPLVARLQKRGLKRKRAVLWIFAGFIVASIAIGSWFVASVARDVQSVTDQARGLIDDFKANQDEWIASWNEMVPTNLQIEPSEDPIGRTFEDAFAQLFPMKSEVEGPEFAAARAQMVTARADLLTSFQRLDTNNDLVITPDEVAGDQFKAIDQNADGSITPDEWFSYFGAPAVRDARSASPGTTRAVDRVIGWAGTGVTGLLTLILFVTLVPIYTWYFMVGFDQVVAKGREYLPGAHRDRIERLLREIDGMLKAFFRGRIVVVAIVTVATTILYLAFGVKYAVLLGLLSGLGVLIPYFSIIAGWIPALLLMWISGDSLVAIIAMSVIFHIIQALEQYVLTPKLLGDAVELHPVTLLVGVFVMASLFGLFGALLAVPLTAIAKTLGREFLLPYFKSVAQERRT